MMEQSPDRSSGQPPRDQTSASEAPIHHESHLNVENWRSYPSAGNNPHSGSSSQHFQGSQPPMNTGLSPATTFPTSREQSPNVYDLSHLANSLPSYHQQTSAQFQDTSRFHGGIGGASAYGHPHFQGNMNTSSGPYQMLGASYGSPYHDTAVASQIYGHTPTLHRPYPGGPVGMHSGLGGSPYTQNMPSQYMLYPGQHAPMASASGFNQSTESYNPDMAGRQYRTTYSNMAAHSNQMIRPDMPRGPHNAGNLSSNSGSIPSAPRGPPRKPKQSGHALWVGNLPTGTSVGDLKDHFSRDATKDIESVFLISKSNCAFVNYRTETACAAAMQRFHDSRFQGVRLVCRLRRGPVAMASGASPPVSGAPAGPASFTTDVSKAAPAPDAVTQNRQVSSKALENAKLEASQRGHKLEKVPEKFFVMKSLTVEDMELSVNNKIWATQEHNEETMNKAYATAENVYLIFSANKSGEYFGYARMASPINDEVSATLDWAPKGGIIADDPDIPRSIPTSATETAPKGRIIDDSARGTIFWEALLDPLDTDVEPKIAVPNAIEGAEDSEEGSGAGGPQSFGKPFRIEWISTDRVPFYRTRGLRNSWNANREVKIARDGTELEPSVGRRLIMMFHEPHPAVNPRMMMSSPALQNMPR